MSSTRLLEQASWSWIRLPWDAAILRSQSTKWSKCMEILEAARAQGLEFAHAAEWNPISFIRHKPKVIKCNQQEERVADNRGHGTTFSSYAE